MASQTIKLEVYLPFRGRRLWRGDQEVATGLTVGELPAAIGLTAPELAVLVGGRHVPPETLLQPGDEVAILRQAEGG
jgi:sulfur carrier protein ThiS